MGKNTHVLYDTQSQGNDKIICFTDKKKKKVTNEHKQPNKLEAQHFTYEVYVTLLRELQRNARYCGSPIQPI